MKPGFKRTVLDVADPEAVRTRLDADAERRRKAGKSPVPPVLLVVAGPSLTYGQVMDFVTPALGTHGTVYVFMEDK